MDQDEKMKQFKELIKDIYVIGQYSDTIVVNDFIKVVESKIAFLLVGKNHRNMSPK